MKTLETITTAKDILALVDLICSEKTDLKYKLCDEKDVRLEYSFPLTAPKWMVPITISGREEIKYFVFDHEFCSLSVQKEYPHLITSNSLKLTDKIAWSSFHHWVFEDKAVKTIFTAIRSIKPVYLPDYWWNRNYCEHQPSCPILFLTPEDVINGFPFKEIITDVKSIELKVTTYNEPVWLLTQKNDTEYIIYPCALHRFCDQLNGSHDFGGKLRNPQKDEELLVYHFLGSSIICPLMAFKVKNEQELSVLRFSQMKLKHQTGFIDFAL